MNDDLSILAKIIKADFIDKHDNKQSNAEDTIKPNLEYLEQIISKKQFQLPKNMPYEFVMLTEHEFSEISGIGIPTIRANRIKGKGCKYYKIGAAVRYKLSDIIEYIEGCKCNSTTENNT